MLKPRQVAAVQHLLAIGPPQWTQRAIAASLHVGRASVGRIAAGRHASQRAAADGSLVTDPDSAEVAKRRCGRCGSRVLAHQPCGVCLARARAAISSEPDPPAELGLELRGEARKRYEKVCAAGGGEPVFLLEFPDDRGPKRAA